MGDIGDCWPCETARNIVDLTGFSNFSQVYHDSGIPFIVKVSLDSFLSKTYKNNDEFFGTLGCLTTFSKFSDHPISIV